MRRREFITLLGGAAAWPITARIQEAGRTYRLGFVFPIGRQAPPVVAFLDELRLNGFIERQNITAVAGSFGLEGRPFAEPAATGHCRAGCDRHRRRPRHARRPGFDRDAADRRHLERHGGGRAGALARASRSQFDRRKHPLARTRRQATRPPHRGGAPRATSCGARRPQYHDAAAAAGAPGCGVCLRIVL